MGETVVVNVVMVIVVGVVVIVVFVRVGVVIRGGYSCGGGR